MRPLSTLTILVSTLCLLGVTTAHADPMPFSGTLTIEILADPPLGEIPLTGSGIAEVSTGSIQFGASIFTARVTVTPPSPDLITQIVVAGSGVSTGTGMIIPGTAPAVNGVASFFTGGGPGGGFGGAMPISGTAFARVLALFYVPLPINVVGVGGTTTAALGQVAITLTGSPWTTGTVTLPAFQELGETGDPGTVMRTGFISGNTIQLVTPVRIKVNILGEIPAFGTLTLTIPEPSSLVLLGAGALGLALLGRKRVS